MTTSLDNDILDVVRKMVNDISSEEIEITPETNLRDLGINSLHAIDLVFRFEEHFNVTIPMDDFPLTNVGEAIQYLKGVLASPRDAAAD